MRKYFNESHRKYSEACQKEVEEMSKHPLSHEQFRAQIKRNREESERRRKESTIWPSRTMTTPTLQTLERHSLAVSKSMAANAFKYVSSLICKDKYNLQKPKQGDVGVYILYCGCRILSLGAWTSMMLSRVERPRSSRLSSSPCRRRLILSIVLETAVST